MRRGRSVMGLRCRPRRIAATRRVGGAPARNRGQRERSPGSGPTGPADWKRLRRSRQIWLPRDRHSFAPTSWRPFRQTVVRRRIRQPLVSRKWIDCRWPTGPAPNRISKGRSAACCETCPWSKLCKEYPKSPGWVSTSYPAAQRTRRVCWTGRSRVSAIWTCAEQRPTWLWTGS